MRKMKKSEAMGTSFMKESGPKKKKNRPIQRRKQPASQKKQQFKTHNEHSARELKEYSGTIPDATPSTQDGLIPHHN